MGKVDRMIENAKIHKVKKRKKTGVKTGGLPLKSTNLIGRKKYKRDKSWKKEIEEQINEEEYYNCIEKELKECLYEENYH